MLFLSDCMFVFVLKVDYKVFVGFSFFIGGGFFVFLFNEDVVGSWVDEDCYFVVKVL